MAPTPGKTDVDKTMALYQESLRDEFKRLSGLALEYRTKVKEAKTSVKKDLYNKKLIKVNKKVYAILAQMTMMSNNEKKPKLDIKVSDNEDV